MVSDMGERLCRKRVHPSFPRCGGLPCFVVPAGVVVSTPVKDNELFEKEPIPRAYMTLAIPIVLSMMVTLVYNTVDTYFIAHTGNTSMLASDGYPFLEPTLDQSERALAELKASDPHLISRSPRPKASNQGSTPSTTAHTCASPSEPPNTQA